VIQTTNVREVALSCSFVTATHFLDFTYFFREVPKYSSDKTCKIIQGISKFASCRQLNAVCLNTITGLLE
jgi:hypothetical protein